MQVAHAPSTSAPSPVYELHASDPLPSINCTKTVKDVLFSPRWLARCNYGLHKFRRVLAVMFPASCVAGWICPFADAHTGRVMGLLVLIFQSVPMVAISLVLRYDVVRLLAGTYEFWYLTLMNWTVTTLGCVKYGDIRAATTFLAFIGYENALLIDATHRGTRNTAALSVMSGLIIMGYGLYMAFDLIDEVHQVVLFSHGNWYVEGGDVIVNGVTTIIIMLLRNAYRKRQRLQVHRNRDKTIVRCITYRCRVRLVSLTSPSDTMLPSSITETSTASTRSQLRLAHPGQMFHSDQLLWDVQLDLFNTETPTRPRILRTIYCMVSLTTALASLVSIVLPAWTALSIFVTAMSTFHLVGCLSICQRQLLRKLLSSFDVAFISVQFTLMLLSIGYLQEWDHRSISTLNCWLWVHWVLLLDAITPVTKSAVGIQHGLAIAVMGLLILGQILVAVDLVFLQRWQLKDRILFAIHIASHTLHLRTASFMLSRIFSVFWWCWRLLWRLMTQKENELILIQEAVEYDDVRRSRRTQSKRPVPTPVVHPAALDLDQLNW